MKNLTRIFAVLFFLTATLNIFSQSAYVKWPLTSDQNPDAPVGNIQALPQTIGTGSGSYILSIYNPYVANGQRLWTGNQGTGWIAGLPDYTRFIQFDASPTSGNDFTVQYLSFNYSDNPLGTDFNIIKSEVWYSTNGWNTKTQLNTSPLDYLNTAVQTFSKSINVLVQNGQTFSMRIYPYTLNGGLAMTPSFATHKNVLIEGVTSPAIINNGSICGRKFNDLNGNGLQDLGETGLANWIINLSYQQAAGTVTLADTTDENGDYCFNNLAAGTYTVSETNQSGWQQTYPGSPGTHLVTLTTGQNKADINFGNKVNSSSSEDACLIWDLLSSGAVTSTTGNLNGQAEIIGAGSSAPFMSVFGAYTSYGQRLLVQGGWLPGSLDVSRYIEFNANATPGNTFTVNYVSFNYGDNPLGTNFNIINSEVYYSTDGWNTSHQLGSILQYLNTSMQTFNASNLNVTISSSQTFSLRIYPYSPTGSIAGTVSLAIHNNVMICGTTEPELLNTGSICGMKFNDLNGNSLQDPGEPGLANWIIKLSYELAAGTVTLTDTTDVNGNYCFNNLAEGLYTVTEVQQTGWTQTAPTASTYSITITIGQNMTGNDFGNKADTVIGCVDPPAGMVAWWSLDETSGTTSLDLAGFNNAGIQFSGPVPVAGKVLGGLQFDGINDYIEVPDHSELNFGIGNFSFDAWIKTNENTGQKTILNKLQFPLNQGYSLYLSNGEVRLIIAASSPVFYVSSMHVADGNWHHIAVTVDRADQNGIKFYKDGIMISTADPTTNPGTISAISPLRIGSLSFTAGDLFKGSLDEIELFNRVLSALEIQSIFNAGSAGKCKPDVQLGSICGFKFNDINGNGIKETGEPGLPNWTINLSGTATAFATTDADGNFCFNNLTAGAYVVSEVQQTGWTQTAPASNTYSITLTEGQNKTDIIFGNNLNPATGCVTPPTGMVAWYPLDEVLGATVVSDIIGTNDGTPQPGPIGVIGSGTDGPVHGSTLSFIVPQAKVNGSLFFYAGLVSKYVKVPNNPSLNFGTGDFSIDAWVYPVIGSNYVQPIVDKVQTTVSYCIGYRLFILNGQLNFVVMDGINVSTTLAPIAYSQWHHIAVTRKGGTPNTIQIYINGVLITTTTPQVNSITNTVDFLIGGISNPSGGTLCGLPAQFNYGEIAIDELEIFNRVITASEIFSIWHSDTFGKCKPNDPTDIKETEGIPQKFDLLQSYPNPFNPSTTIRYDISKAGFVNISVYDALGREIRVLVNEERSPGVYEVKFDGNNLASGIYYYIIRTQGYIQSKKMILLK